MVSFSLKIYQIYFLLDDLVRNIVWIPGHEVIKLFSCSTQLNMQFFLPINVKMPTIVDIVTFMSRKK